MYQPELEYHFNQFALAFRDFDARIDSVELFRCMSDKLEAFKRAAERAEDRKILDIIFKLESHSSDIRVENGRLNPVARLPLFDFWTKSLRPYFDDSSYERPFQSLLDLLGYLKQHPQVFHSEKIDYQTRVEDKAMSRRIDRLLNRLISHHCSPSSVIAKISDEVKTISHMSVIPEKSTPKRPMDKICEEAVLEMERRVKELRIKWLYAFTDHLEFLLRELHSQEIVIVCTTFQIRGFMVYERFGPELLASISRRALSSFSDRAKSIVELIEDLRIYIARECSHGMPKKPLLDKSDNRARTTLALTAMRSNASARSRRNERIANFGMVGYYAGSIPLGTAMALRKRFGR